MSTLVLHIGTPKTGTTFLQKLLSAHREDLKESGWVYPDLGGRHNHTELAYAFFTGADNPRSRHYVRVDQETSRAEIRELLTVEVQPDTHWIISSETLSRMAPDDAATLLEFLGEFFDDIKVLVYLRRQEFFMESRYSQRIKNGESRPWDWDTLRELVTDLEPLEMYRKWSAIVGVDNVIARPYLEDFKRDSEALLVDFREAVGIPDSIDLTPINDGKLTNVRLSAEGLQFLSALNPHFPMNRINGKPNHGLRARTIARLQELTAGPMLTLSGELAARFDAEYRPNNKVLADELGGEQWQRWLNQQAGDDGSASAEPISPTRMCELMIELSYPRGPLDMAFPDWRHVEPPPQLTVPQRIRRKFKHVTSRASEKPASK